MAIQKNSLSWVANCDKCIRTFFFKWTIIKLLYVLLNIICVRVHLHRNIYWFYSIYVKLYLRLHLHFAFMRSSFVCACVSYKSLWALGQDGQCLCWFSSKYENNKNVWEMLALNTNWPITASCFCVIECFVFPQSETWLSAAECQMNLSTRTLHKYYVKFGSQTSLNNVCLSVMPLSCHSPGTRACCSTAVVFPTGTQQPAAQITNRLK